MKKSYRLFLLLSVSTLLALPGFARNNADTLKVGDPAPQLKVFKWLKGSPVEKFTPGHVYVIEFWATWCGPCRAAMPHVSELARKYKDKVTVIGMDVWEEAHQTDKGSDNLPKVMEFVKYIRDGMDYTVAADSKEGEIANTWLKPAGIKGIPTTIVVDQKGTIAWIGNPTYLDEVLENVVAGTYDDAAKEQIKKARTEWIANLTAAKKEMDELVKAGDKQKALVATEKYLALTKDKKAIGINNKLKLLSDLNPTEAEKYAETILKEYAPDPLNLYNISDELLKSENKNLRKIALKMAEEFASRNAPDDLSSAMLLGKAYYCNGENKKAVTYQEKVLAKFKAIETNPQTKDAVNKMIEEAEQTLQKYKSL